MPNFQIGLSGLRVAQRALEIIGTNIANASTEGYHRQDLRIVPISMLSVAGTSIGGARIAEIRRAMDLLLEGELLQQRPRLGQVTQELLTLQSVESAFGEFGSGGLTDVLGNFFGSLQELASQPGSRALQEQAVWAADALARNFQNLGQFLLDLENHIGLEGQRLMEKVNALTAEIAALNGEIHTLTTRGDSPNLLMDLRDQAISDLAELMEVQVNQVSGQSGVVNVLACGTPLVMGRSATKLELGVTVGDKLGVSVKDAGSYTTDLSGGRIGGLIALKNDIFDDLQADLDALASEIIHNINAHHVQGVGSAGSFTSLTGWALSPAELGSWSAWGSHLNEGTFYVRVTDRIAGTATSHAISVTAADTVQTVAGKLDALTGLTAGVVDSALRIAVESESQYRFDFLPAPITTLQGGWSGTSNPTVLGIYTGQAEELYTCTVTAGGTVGLTEGLVVEVRNQAGEVVTELNLGAGYAAGDAVELAGGLSVTFQSGTLTGGEQFTIQALADSDSSGFLSAAGINTFFRGDSLVTAAVSVELLNNPGRLAFAIGQEMSDNTNARRMADLGEKPLAALSNMSPTDSCRMIITGVGERISFGQSRQSSLESMMLQLANHRDRISGVDINEEAAKLLMFEKMYQAMAKLIQTQDSSLQTLMELL